MSTRTSSFVRPGRSARTMRSLPRWNTSICGANAPTLCRPVNRLRPEPTSSNSRSISSFQRWNDEMDRLFDDVGSGRNLFTGRQSVGAFAPQIEVFERGNDLIVRADLPGLAKDDIQVDINDDVLTIQGERKQQHEEEREGYYRNERSYGSFSRAVPLP